VLANSLLHTYAKCANIMQAESVFDDIVTRSKLSSNIGIDTLLQHCWNVMLMAYAHKNMMKDAISCFNRMTEDVVSPDSVTFIVLMSGCAHAGLIDECIKYYDLMKTKYNIEPTFQHHACVVDGLCRKGRFKEAKDLIRKLKKWDSVLWMTLLGACRTKIMKMQSTGAGYNKVVLLAEHAAKEIMKLQPADAASYVALGNIYGAAGMKDKEVKLRERMIELGIKKIAGISWMIDLDGECHTFYANNVRHPRYKDIRAMWNKLATQIEYQPDLRWVLQNETDEEKKLRLCLHSEKMALCYALLVIPPEHTIHIVKNLRMCGDCHTATALISHIVNRKIVIRDAKVWHTFENSQCSCGGIY